MGSKTVNWGIIGPGKIAHKFAGALVTHKDCHLAAVASRNLERATAFASQYGIETVYSSYDSLYQDDAIDVVYIATPHAFHFQQAKTCLEAGKHVLVEKPATINSKQWQILVEIAKRNQCTLIEAVWSRFMPCFKQVKEWLHAGKIGEVTYVRSDIGFSFLETRELDYSHRLFDPSQGGGALLDLGIYSIALSQLAIDSSAVTVQAMADIGPSKVDQTTLVNVTYQNSKQSQFTCSAVSEPSNDMTINGTKGHIKLPGLFWVGEEATLVQSTDQGKGKHVETKRFENDVNGFEYQIREMVNCITHGQVESALMPHQDTYENLQLMDQIRKTIDLTFPDSVESTE